MSFVPLRCHSNYSFLCGPLSIERLLGRLTELGYGAAALTDNDGLYGTIAFVQAAGRRGVRPLIGLEIDTACGPFVFLARNLAGYGSLCRISTIKTLDERKPSVDDVLNNRSGLIAIYLGDDLPPALVDGYGRDIYIGVESIASMGAEPAMTQKSSLAKRFGLSMVAADPVYFAETGDARVNRALAAIKYLKSFAGVESRCLAPAGALLAPPEEMIRRYRHIPQAITATIDIAERCQFDLPLGRINFPRYEQVTEIANRHLLRRRAEAGLRRRYGRITGEVYSRFESELAIIEQTGFVDYFLIVADIIDFCRRSGIRVVGRGSAASSIIAYCLGVTQVDPIEQNLYFARFLNEARTDPPDIDLDLCWRRRDEVLDYVYRRFGRNRTAMIATLNTFAARGAIRELGKAFGLSEDEISDITKRLPWGRLGDLEKTMRDYPECADLPVKSEPYRTIIELACKIEGYPRHLSIHCGGMVIAPGELLDLVPLQMSAKGIAITQYDMHGIAALGLVKIDLLGQRGLSTIADAETAAGEKSGGKVIYDWRDPDTFRMLQQGRTIGVFQIESPGLRSLLIELQPKTIDDITLALALIRPGAAESGMKKLYLERLAGEKPVVYPHKSLEPVLAETLGNIVYQEQVLRTAEVMAGFSPAQADLLRKAMTKERGIDEFHAFAEKFLVQASARGVPPLKAREVFALLTRFAGYGFCKAHAATYAKLSYQAAFLKAHHPIEFMAAMLNNFAGYYAPLVYADEARRLGAKLRPPDIDKPAELCVVEGNELRIGLAFVKGLSAATREAIIKQRAKRPFVSLGDFLVRVKPAVDETEKLIRIGAFDYSGQTRPALLWYMKTYGRKILAGGGQTPLLGDVLPETPRFPVGLGDYDIQQRLLAEQEILDMAISCHPANIIPFTNGQVKSSELAACNGKEVRIVGLVVDRKRIRTGNDKLMVFLTMEDDQDYFEVTVFPGIYRRFGARIFRRPLLEVTGKAQNRHGVLTVIASKLQACA